MKDLIRSLFDRLPFLGAPYIVTDPHGPGHFLLTQDKDGLRYVHAGTPKPEPAPAKLVRKHRFISLDDLAAYSCGDIETVLSVAFVATSSFVGAAVVVLYEDHPEMGARDMVVDRHPAWQRWSAGAGKGEHRDLTHHQLADLLLDNQEDLDQAALAPLVAQFRAAKVITYDADLGSNGHVGVKATFKGTGGKGGTTTDVELPREFMAHIPAYSGAWTPGHEPRHVARFRLRVMPPSGEGAEPVFRLIWVNAKDYELEAARALVFHVRETLKPIPTYSGSPSCSRYFLGGDEQA